eukprot:scaffold2113_cov105-Skeletonema_marinoi.AAC.4
MLCSVEIDVKSRAFLLHTLLDDVVADLCSFPFRLSSTCQVQSKASHVVSLHSPSPRWSREDNLCQR